MQQSTFLWEEPPAKVSASRDFARALMTLVGTSCSHSELLQVVLSQPGLSGKTSPEYCQATEGGILEPSSGCWQNSGMGSPTEFLTLTTSAAPYLARVCSLSQILEPAGEHLRPYYLTPALLRTATREAEAGRAHIHSQRRTPEAGTGGGT